jgi:hypothetical protein
MVDVMIRDKPATPPGANKIPPGLKWVKRGAHFACVASFIGLGVNMAIHHRRGEDERHPTRVVWVFMGVLVIESSTALVTSIASLK